MAFYSDTHHNEIAVISEDFAESILLVHHARPGPDNGDSQTTLSLSDNLSLDSKRNG